MSSTSGDLRPDMVESETPPSGMPSDRADEPEVSSRREPPGLAKPDSSAPASVRLKDLLEKASISEDHHALMSVVIERISSAEGGLHNVVSSLLAGFEVRKNDTPLDSFAYRMRPVWVVAPETR